MRNFFGHPSILRDNLKLQWDACTAVGWGSWQLCEHVPRFSQEMKCQSTHTMQDILAYQPRAQISFFPLHTPKSGHKSLLLHWKVELKLQGIIFTHPVNAQRIQTQAVEWKQFSGKGKPNMWYGNSWVAIEGRTWKVSVVLALVWNVFKCVYCVQSCVKHKTMQDFLK